MPYNYPALKDTIENIVYEDYKRVIHTVDITMDQNMHVHVELTFSYDNCVRNFMLTEYSFEDES